MGLMKRARLEHAQSHRCEACGRPALGGGSLCLIHRERRKDYGSTKLRGLPILRRNHRGGRSRREWQDIVPMVKTFFKQHPPAPEIVFALNRVLDPGVPPTSLRSTHPKAVLYRELAWFQDPRSRKKPHSPARGWLRDRYAPKVILASLIAATVYILERDRSFPGESEACSLGYVFASHWKRPRYPAGHPVPLRASTRRLLAAKIRACLGVYLHTTSLEIVKQREALEASMPRRKQQWQPPPPRIVTPVGIARSQGGWPLSTVKN
jgi:hypothetical protein